MGLDMYLHAKKTMPLEVAAVLAKSRPYDVNPWHNPWIEEPPSDGSDVLATLGAAYWRKANAIHGWFVRNIQSGQDDRESYEVTRQELQKLIALCQRCIASGKASLFLKPMSGLFFGSTEIDQGYWDDLKKTVESLTKVLEEFDDSWQLVYHSSW